MPAVANDRTLGGASPSNGGNPNNCRRHSTEQYSCRRRRQPSTGSAAVVGDDTDFDLGARNQK